jgi:hypothetical protein
MLYGCRVPLLDVSNVSNRCVRKSSDHKSHLVDREEDCREIQSPAAFELFDLGINRDLNKRSSLFQQLKSNMKVNLAIMYPYCFLMMITCAF